MNTATLELSEGDWVRIILALHSKAENTDFDPAYCKQIATLADEIEELVAVQIKG